jgi:hypothetical protein
VRHRSKSSWLIQTELRSRQSCKECASAAKIALQLGPRLCAAEPGPQSRSVSCGQSQSDRRVESDDTRSVQLGEDNFGRETTSLDPIPATAQLVVLQHLVQVHVRRRRRAPESPTSEHRLAEARRVLRAQGQPS